MSLKNISITVLSNNCAGTLCGAEHGLSLFIEADEPILFDTGASDLFLQNAKVLKIDLSAVKKVVLSHGHFDHGNGLILLENKTVFCHPTSFSERFRKKSRSIVGLNYSLSEAKLKHDIIETTTTKKISNNIHYLGEIPRINNFEAQHTYFEFKDGSEDYIMDDSGIAIVMDKGLVVVSGCAHAGICNTIEQAKKVSGINKVYAVMGGFHLKTANEITEQTIEYLRKEKVEKILPMHCTAFPAMVKFNEAFNSKEIKTGDKIVL